MLTVGIDIGTTSVCVLFADAAAGETVRVVSRDNDAELSGAHPWERLQDPERILEIVREQLRECSREWEAAAAVCVSCQMHGILYVDRRGSGVSPLYTWQDGRGDRRMPDGEITYAERLGAIAGRKLHSGYGLVTHFYNARNGLVPSDAASFCTIGDYVAMKLCGLSEPAIDPSNAAGFGLFSLEQLDFERKAVEAAGMDSSLLPRVVRDGGAIGRTPDGKTVVCAIGDNQASFLGAVSRPEGSLLVNVGTGSQISVYTDRCEKVAGLETRPFPGGGYLLVGAPLSGGKSYALLKRFFQETCRAFGAEAGDRDFYGRMNEMAGQALTEGIEPLAFDTRFYGSRRDPSALGGVAGLSPQTFTPGHFAAGVLAGMADELTEYFRLLPEPLRAKLESAIGAGNGMRRNPVLQRLLREWLGLPLRLAAVEEEAAFGAAKRAAAGAGLLPR
ncbi:sedoheptulokinase [Cohnella zeiphila]|uniref:Sedoheptulokinase n=1 Tax=Cohnella zeiphila TaxID=2761120 RepID=A0A7X0VYW8_9BACL|nr:FGGY family carbohydrate kinase [Cohnella zeiphila]MBB6735804.1 hypothetical protein [Cohnella zeiphila]